MPSVSDGHTYNCYGGFDVFPSLVNVDMVRQKLAHALECYVFIATVEKLQGLCSCRLVATRRGSIKLIKAHAVKLYNQTVFYLCFLFYSSS